MDTATDGQRQLHLLYRDHHGWLQGGLRKRLGDREHAADVAQDTFLRLQIACIKGFAKTPHSLETTRCPSDTPALPTPRPESSQS